MDGTDRPLRGQRIGLFGRGGRGKSTCTVLLAKALVKAGYQVCVLNADSTNEGLAQALGADRAPDSLVNWFGGTIFSGGAVTCPVDDPTPLNNGRVQVGRLPARFVGKSPDGILVFTAGKIGPLGLGAGCDGPMTKIARDFTPEMPGCPPVVLVDFKAGIENVSRGVITSLDWVVVVIDSSFAGVRAAITMQGLIDQLRAGRKPATRHLTSAHLAALAEENYKRARTKGVFYILNKVPDPETEHELWQQLIAGRIPAGAVIREDPEIRRAWLEGVPVTSAAALAEAEKVVKAMEENRGAQEATASAKSGLR